MHKFFNVFKIIVKIYLHNYFENIKKLEKCFPICNMRPLSNARPPGRGVRGVLPPALIMFIAKFERGQPERGRKMRVR